MRRVYDSSRDVEAPGEGRRIRLQAQNERPPITPEEALAICTANRDFNLNPTL